MSASVTLCPPETDGDAAQVSRKDQVMSMTRKTKGSPCGAAKPTTVTLVDVLIALEHETLLSATRLRDLHSAVKRVASLLGNEPAAIPLDLPAISTKLASVNPIAV